MKTNFYVDGFNLYYRALQHSPYRWLDLRALFVQLFPDNPANKIRYFTSHVSGSANPESPVRQQLYLRALGTIPDLSCHYGKFHRNRVYRPLVRPTTGSPTHVEVWDTKEKGSDVSLASMLLFDAHHEDFEAAIVVSNDSDLLLPVQLVVQEFKKPVGILDPAGKRSKSLYGVSSFYRHLHKSDLAASQFPNTMSDDKGEFNKPVAWGLPRIEGT
jgi:hypothetical protein